MPCGQPASAWKRHLAVVHKLIAKFRPKVVVIDPITNLVAASGAYSIKSMLMRLVDFLKVQQITSMFTNLTFCRRPPGENCGGRLLSYGHLDCVARQQTQWDDRDASFTF